MKLAWASLANDKSNKAKIGIISKSSFYAFLRLNIPINASA